MNAAEYDNWYETPRGRWVGERETAQILVTGDKADMGKGGSD